MCGNQCRDLDLVVAPLSTEANGMRIAIANAYLRPHVLRIYSSAHFLKYPWTPWRLNFFIADIFLLQFLWMVNYPIAETRYLTYLQVKHLSLLSEPEYERDVIGILLKSDLREQSYAKIEAVQVWKLNISIIYSNCTPWRTNLNGSWWERWCDMGNSTRAAFATISQNCYVQLSGLDSVADLYFCHILPLFICYNILN